MTYSIFAFGRMIDDRERTESYVKALQASVRPGSVVVDIGAGTGVFSLVACQLGARKVVVIEPNEAIQVARESVNANGFSDQVEFVQDLSTVYASVEKADVVVADIRGVLPMHQTSINSMIDARERLLKPKGTLIPGHDSLWATLVQHESIHKQHISPWHWEPLGLNLKAGRPYACNHMRKEQFQPKQLVVEAQCWAELDYRTIVEANIKGSISWTLSENIQTHGIAAWFDTELLPGIGYSNAPQTGRELYGTMYFPFDEVINAQKGQRIQVSIQAKPVNHDYVWIWEAAVFSEDGTRIQRVKQSSLFSSSIHAQRIQKVQDQQVTALSPEGLLALDILEQMRSGLTILNIGRAVYKAYPDRFNDEEDAVHFVAGYALKYT